MRSRFLRVSLAAVAVAVLVLGVPLSLAVVRIVTDEQHSALERAALRAAVVVSPDYASGDPIELPGKPGGTAIGVYDVRGRLVTGSGPAHLEGGLDAALRGTATASDSRDQVAQAVPVTAHEAVIAVVRAAVPASTVRTRVAAWLAVLAALCVAAGAFAGGFALAASRRVVSPLTRLRATADGLGEGDLTARAPASGVPEIDAVADSMNRTAGRLADMVERERSFSEQASHQLRTPLTHLQLELEAGLARGGDALRDAAASAMGTADQLSRTIDDVLSLARPGAPGPTFDVETLLETCRTQWQGPLAAVSRPLRVVVDQPMRVAAALAPARQILHVLLDNAVTHGQGTVTLRARESHGAVAIDVADEGSAPPIQLDRPGTLGLGLATTLARAEQGRLLVDQQGPGTRFTVLLPAAPAGAD